MTNSNSPEKGLNHQVNIHGYGFQYAVVKAAHNLFKEKKSPWMFEVSEFPVETNGVSTHIDFILRNKRETFYFVSECKRANPAISNWCFIKNPYVSRKSYENQVLVREVLVNRSNSGDPPITTIDTMHHGENLYRLSFEVKSGQKGEGSQGRGQINSAITQVIRGQNGLVKFFARELTRTKNDPISKQIVNSSYAAFMPVIFTTANIWISDVDLSDADLDTGNLDLSSSGLEETGWIMYQYSQTPDISHNLSGMAIKKSLSDALYLEYSRTIPIVNANYIEDFLSQYFWKDPGNWNRITNN